ncbi:hypothetical protein [Rhizobium arsenicireducens]
MMPAEEQEFAHGRSSASHDRWRKGDDDGLEGARNWAVILVHVSLMTVPFLAVAWFLA